MSRTKRKFDDHEDFDLNLPSKMKKDQFRVCSSSSSSSSPSSSSSSTSLQFFVRMISEGKTLVLHSTYHHTIKQIHEQIQFITKIPMFEQRLIYRGKQLQYDQTLAECLVQNDATLQLVGRMRSTEHPKAWQLVDEMVSLICKLCKGKSTDLRKNVKSRLVEFLKQTPKENGQKAGGHLGIFVSSCAPKALVMLYMSPVSGNKDCGGECIREFVGLSKDLLPKGLYEYCAPIVLEFCRLLGRWDPLYALCRSSLGSMVECVGVGGGLNSGVRAQEIVPFMIEIAGNLAKELESCLGLPLATDVKDFSAFLVPLRTVVMGQVGFECRVSMPFYEGGEVVKIVYGIYVDMMGKIEGCLEGIEKCLVVKERGEVGEVVHSGWSQYLTLLKELNSISKLYEGAEEEFWAKLSQRKVSLCYLIVKFAVRGDDHRWILEHKDVINFESRRHLTMLILPEVKDEYEELHEMLIDRSQLLAESFEYIAHADPDALRGGLFLEFKNEEATGPGVLREWFFLVCQAIFNPQNALFVACPNDRRRFFPNPASNVDPLHLDYFCFSGRVIALALVHKVQVGIVFDRVFFLQLAGMNVSLEDIRDADPFLYSSCKQILEMDSEIVDQDTLGLTFVREVEELGNRKVVELCPDGKSIAVNSRNRKEYVDLLIRDRFVTSIAEQVSKFAQGFADIISSERLKKLFFQSLELEDLDWMLHGSESDISVEDWKAHIEYNGYKETDPQIIWFWKIVGEMSVEQRKVLLFFWTSVKYLPIEGFGGLASRLYIYKSTESFDHLPSSHTCFYRLCFPSYPSMEIMRERLHLITQEHVGCSFGTW